MKFYHSFSYFKLISMFLLLFIVSIYFGFLFLEKGILYISIHQHKSRTFVSKVLKILISSRNQFVFILNKFDFLLTYCSIYTSDVIKVIKLLFNYYFSSIFSKK